MKLYILYYMVLILIIVYCLAINKSYGMPELQKPTHKFNMEIVIANYEENLDWIHEIPEDFYSHITIYNKGSDKLYNYPKTTVLKLPNYGRESHTYLYHVVNNYYNLESMTLFIPGSIWNLSHKQIQLIYLLNHLNYKNESVVCAGKNILGLMMTSLFFINSYTITDLENRRGNPDTKLRPAEVRPFGAWIAARFPGETLKCRTHNGIMAVSRNDIHKRPLEFYKAMLDEHSYKNTEVVHYSERAWSLIFSIPEENCIPLFF